MGKLGVLELRRVRRTFVLLHSVSARESFLSLLLCKVRVTATTIPGSSTSIGARERPSHLDLGLVFVLVYFT